MMPLFMYPEGTYDCVVRLIRPRISQASGKPYNYCVVQTLDDAFGGWFLNGTVHFLSYPFRVGDVISARVKHVIWKERNEPFMAVSILKRPD